MAVDWIKQAQELFMNLVLKFAINRTNKLVMQKATRTKEFPRKRYSIGKGKGQRKKGQEGPEVE